MDNSNTYYVYQHIRIDTNQIFYIGIGKQESKRCISNSGRNKHWKNIVKKNNNKFIVELLFENVTKEFAVNKEIELIQKYGRIINKTGILVNVLKGGQLQDIGPNYKKEYTEKIKKKMSKSHEGNHASLGHIWINNGIIQKSIHKSIAIPEGFVKGGLKRPKMSDETRLQMSLSKKGKDMGFTKEQRSNWTKGNKSALGYRWTTNGIINLLIKPNEQIKEGYYFSRTRNYIKQLN